MCGWIVLAIIIINVLFLAIAIKNAKIIERSEQLCECKCEYPIIRSDVIEYCSICQLEVK